MKLLGSLLLLGAFAQEGVASPPPSYGYQPACAADKCFSAIRSKPALSSIAFSFCKSYIPRPTTTKTVLKTTTKIFTTTPGRAVVTKTVSATQTSVVTITPAQISITQEVTATSTATSTVTPDQITQTTTISITTNVETTSVCGSTTVTSALPTSISYRVRGGDSQKRSLEERNAPSIPKQLSSNCGSGPSLKAKFSSACACFIPKTCTSTVTKTSTAQTTVTARGYGYGKTTVTTTVTAATITSTVTATAPGDASITTTVATDTITVTVTAPAPDDATASDTTTVTSTSVACSTSTVTALSGICGGPSISATTYTSGRYTCTSSAIPPGETINRFRIEGGSSEGNIFEGCISTGPRNITTPSGGTHLCDGTNNNANPAPGGTFTTDIDSAGRRAGFDFDGTYSNSFRDFFITRISSTASSGNAFWGILRNTVFTARGGCQEQVSPFDEALWAFDAFAPNRLFLDLDLDYAVVRPGESVTVTVLAVNPNSGNSSPAQGATLGSFATDSDGRATFTAPMAEGCYQYKAERANSIRSKAFYLTVTDRFAQ